MNMLIGLNPKADLSKLTEREQSDMKEDAEFREYETVSPLCNPPLLVIARPFMTGCLCV